ncbi:MAG: hypothetical protein ABF290_17050 [Thiogranum sp.]
MKDAILFSGGGLPIVVNDEIVAGMGVVWPVPRQTLEKCYTDWMILSKDTDV